MPIFEYTCNGCKAEFETLVLGENPPECPSCCGRDLTKKLSVFSVGRASGPVQSKVERGCESCPNATMPGGCPRGQ